LSSPRTTRRHSFTFWIATTTTRLAGRSLVTFLSPQRWRTLLTALLTRSSR
jgi:hypothetical protein